jgi:DNA ligase-1
MFKPMLAPNEDPMKLRDYFERLRYPLACSPKLDGIRNIVKEEACKSRTYINLPSKQVQELFSCYAELDGEIIVGAETDHDVYNRTQSHIMSKDKPAANISFRVFDCADEAISNEPFTARLQHAKKLIQEYEMVYNAAGLVVGNVSLIPHTLCNSYEELITYEGENLELGYEGIMMRDPLGKYKHGRGTFNEGLIYKLKRFQDDEAVVLGFVEQLTNGNEKVRDNLGNAKRSTCKEGMTPADTMGKIVVDFQGALLEVAPGAMKHDERKWTWENQDLCVGKYIKFRHFPHGAKDMPRFPRFVGWRNPIDFGELK